MHTILLLIIIVITLIGSSSFIEGKGGVVGFSNGLPRYYTDMLRGLSIIMIIYGHVCGIYHEGVWFSPFACTGVAVFLMLSGYGNNESYIKNRCFPFKRVLKIAIPYWVILFVTLYFNYTEYTWKSLLLDILLVKSPMSHYWFVGYIFKWYFVYWITINYFYRYRWLLFSLMAILSFIFLSPLEADQSLSFITGVFISEKKCLKDISKKRCLLISVIAFVVGTFALGIKQMSWVRESHYIMSLAQVIVVGPYALCLITSLMWIKWMRTNYLLQLLAPFTYELYLVHMQFLRIIETTNSVIIASTTLVFFLISFVCASLMCKIDKKIIIHFLN